jgi:hypothetical protein
MKTGIILLALSLSVVLSLRVTNSETENHLNSDST